MNLRNFFINEKTRTWIRHICELPFMRSIIWELMKFSAIQSVDVRRESRTWRLSTRDAVISRQLFVRGEYDKAAFLDAVSLMHARKCVTGHLFVDIGANIGTHTIYALESGLGLTQAICFEPNPENTASLCFNLRMNGYEQAAVIVECALGDKTDTVVMELSPTNFGDHRIRVSADSKVGDLYTEGERPIIHVPQVRLVDWFKEHNRSIDEIGFISIDIQGYEAFALAGAADVCARGVPLYIEFWPYGLQRTGSMEQLIMFLRNHYEWFIDMRKTSCIHAASNLTDFVQSIGLDDGINLLFFRS